MITEAQIKTILHMGKYKSRRQRERIRYLKKKLGRDLISSEIEEVLKDPKYSKLQEIKQIINGDEHSIKLLMIKQEKEYQETKEEIQYLKQKGIL